MASTTSGTPSTAAANARPADAARTADCVSLSGPFRDAPLLAAATLGFPWSSCAGVAGPLRSQGATAVRALEPRRTLGAGLSAVAMSANASMPAGDARVRGPVEAPERGLMDPLLSAFFAISGHRREIDSFRDATTYRNIPFVGKRQGDNPPVLEICSVEG
jgi:hypothetical protein